MRSLILEVIAIVVFAVVFCLAVLFKSADVAVGELIGLASLGLAFHAAAHLP